MLFPIDQKINVIDKKIENTRTQEQLNNVSSENAKVMKENKRLKKKIFLAENNINKHKKNYF